MVRCMATSDVPAPPWAAATRRRGEGASGVRRRRERPLELEEILDATLSIIDAEGTEAVTMRRVAGDLGSSASGLYVHVKDRESLLRAVADRLLDALPALADSGDWRADVKQLLCETHRLLAGHGDLAVRFFSNVPTGAGSLTRFEELLGRLLSAGVPVRVAAWGLDRLLLYTVADVFEGWCFTRRGLTEPGQFADEIRTYFGSLPAERFPNLVTNAEVLVSGDSWERFEMGLDMLIAGIAGTIGTDGPGST